MHITKDDFAGIAGLLSPLILELVEVLGAQAAYTLLSAHGGTTINVNQCAQSRGAATHAYLAELIGDRAADKLAATYGRYHRLYIPRCAAALRELRNRRIRASFDALTLRAGLTEPAAVMQLALEFGLSDRNVRRIVATLDTPAPVKDKRQMFLF